MNKAIQEPLLYIEQPNISFPEVTMQTSYFSRTDKRTDRKKEKEKSETNDSFKNLTIAEKINYLIQVSNHTAPLKCEIMLDKRVERGIVLQANEDEIKMRTLTNEVRTIHIEQIKEIQLIGF